MKVAYVLYDGITWLDFIGIYDPVSRLKSMNFIPELSWETCGLKASVKDSFGLEIKVQKVNESLQDYDMIFIPGGIGTRELQTDEEFINWIKTAKAVPLKLSVCTGSLILGAAGFLKGKAATTHFDEYNLLKKYCREVRTDKIVEDGNIITGGAVSSSIDLGLYLCEKLVGREARQAIANRMDYQC